MNILPTTVIVTCVVSGVIHEVLMAVLMAHTPTQVPITFKLFIEVGGMHAVLLGISLHALSSLVTIKISIQPRKRAKGER